MVKEVIDILIDATSYDLIITANGDFKVGDGTMQHQQHLLLAGKGDYKLLPMVGVDAFKNLHDSNSTLARDARIEFIKDGMNVRAVNNTNNNLIIDAHY